MDKIAVQLSYQERRVIKQALHCFVAMHLDKALTKEERLSLSVIIDIIDKMPDKISAPEKSKIKLKYYQAHFVALALKKVLEIYDSMHESEFVVINEVKDKLDQKL